MFYWAMLLLFALSVSPCHAVTMEQPNGTLRVEVRGVGVEAGEIISIKVGAVWQAALLATTSPVRIKSPAGEEICVLRKASQIEHGLLLTGECKSGEYQQWIVASPDEKDVIDVSTRVTLHHGAAVNSIEDRYDFLPERHPVVSAEQGPLDFVWSQNIKNEPDDLIPAYGFKSPAVMMQQGPVFVALVPKVSQRQSMPLALDLDVTSEKRPWIAFGEIPSEPYGHSYFRRSSAGHPKVLADTVEYSYSMVASEQPSRLGYRRVVRRLWMQSGHPALLNSPDLQQNVIQHELRSFASWRKQAWELDANKMYLPVECGGKRCGTLPSNRNISGDWQHTESDAWFNAWFQTLRTAYGWYLYGRETHDSEAMAKAESVLNLALSAPQKNGAFPTIYMVNQRRWIADDGWAGYQNDYHAFCMSWTAYWMLRWAEDLEPQRSKEVLHFAKAYGDFLLQHQLPSGVIPSWYSPALQPREEFRDFNAETAPSALFLTALGTATGDHAYIVGAEKAMSFIEREVVPRARWFDFETFLSCARKDYGFYDRWTAQFPQNNLAEIQAPSAWLALYHATRKPEYLEKGTESLDYLLLTQQVWSNPAFSPRLLGGFTTQNTDAEWSDARQSYVAVVLLDYFRATGKQEYLERAVAAARSTFAVAPWENWAHTGYIDEPGALTGFHWGTGSAMTSVEIMSPLLGDAFIDLKTSAGAGFDDCSVRNLLVRSNEISFNIESPEKQRTFLIKFSGVVASQRYRIAWNGLPTREVTGRDLIANGYRVGPLVAADTVHRSGSQY